MAMSSQTTIDPATLARLNAISDTEWKTIYTDLLIYADAKLGRCGFRVISEKDSVTGEDFVTLAIEKVFSGERKWDFANKPDIKIHLISIIKSLVSSHFKSSVRAAQKVVVKDVEIVGLDDDEVHQLHDPDQPDEIIIREEQWKEIEKKFGDEEACLLFFDWCDGKKSNAIAEDWSVEASAVYAAVKKGKRLVKEIIRNN